MPDKPEKVTSAESRVRAPHACHGVDSAHYLRQATITLRRHSSWINQLWHKHHHPAAGASTWKH